ncbi:hypothetical protein K501DRAFT_333099 [Backusella circina FSU 941]|nr:hypothetical protein K501DRAFT_333099 [Backusella circina FSU 941]
MIVKTRKVGVNSILIESFNSFWLQRLEGEFVSKQICLQMDLFWHTFLDNDSQDRFYYKASTAFGFQQLNVGLCKSRSARNGMCSSGKHLESRQSIPFQFCRAGYNKGVGDTYRFLMVDYLDDNQCI